jgi:hypothetical protein
MSSQYKRSSDASKPSSSLDAFGDTPDEEAMEGAAEALREVEVEAVKATPESPVDPAKVTYEQLHNMSIDDLRVLARDLDVPDRSKITEQDELIEAIRRRL